MRDKGLIMAGLVAFVGLITFPIWYDIAGGKTSAPPDLKLPTQAKECVMPVEYMKASHMNLLLTWRDEVVRYDNRTFRNDAGKTYTISLNGTCLEQCHTSKAEFCDRCHNYNGVSDPYCWDCHVDPQLAKPAVQRAGLTPGGEEHGDR